MSLLDVGAGPAAWRLCWGWVLDPVTVDGCGLDSGLEDGARNSECMCDNQAECDTIRERMDKVYLPTAEELMRLLAESLGYTVTKAVRS